MSDTPDFAALAVPFSPHDIEWRIQSCGQKGDKVWALCIAYVNNRAIMNRLDEVAGPANWRNQYAAAPCGGVMCGLSIRADGEWVTKWDGAENTDIEGVKGGLSGAMKRAAVQWGIGRYLYELEESFAQVRDNGQYRGKTKEGAHFNWDPPTLPGWAQPKPEPAPSPNGSQAPTPEQLALINRILKSHVFTDSEREAISKALVKTHTKAKAGDIIDRITTQVNERKEAEKAAKV